MKPRFFKMTTRMITALTFAAAATVSLVLTTTSASAATLVTEDFDGTGLELNGKTATSFSSAIISAGGSATWAAGSSFFDDGTVSVAGGGSSASLNLGSYIDDAKGTPSGQFDLTLTISETVGEWIALGFSTLNEPVITNHFTNGPSIGIATIIRREVDDWDLDMFPGPGTNGRTEGPEPTGARTLTVSLDFTPAGGYDGATNYGTVTFSDSILGELGSFTYTSDNSFGSIMIGEAGNSGGSVSNLSLTQIPEPASLTLVALGAMVFLARRRRS